MLIGRRNILKGLTLGAGSALLSPIMSRIAMGAEGEAAKLPKRFVFAIVNSGIVPEVIEPTTLKETVSDKKKYVNVSLAEHTLEPAMKPFEPLKNYLSIIQGLSGKMCSGGHTANYGALGVCRTPGEGSSLPPNRATVDALIAKLHPAAINHVALALTGSWGSRETDGVVYPFISTSGPGRPVPFQASPDLAFEQLFGSVASTDKYSQRKLSSKKNLLDFMSNDIKKAQRALPSSEKDKLDHYLSALEDLKGQDVKIAALKENLAKNLPEMNENYTSDVSERRQEAHFELIAAALISGLTNVVTMRLDNSATYYKGLGLSEVSVHGIGHNEVCNGKSSEESREMIRRHHFDLLAHLANKLKKIPEGIGNMLDNTMIIYMSDSGNKHHGTLEEWPIVVLGGCANKMKLSGRYIRYPGYGENNHKTIGNWWTTVLNAYGSPVSHYGDFDPGLMKAGFNQAGPLQDILA